MSRRTLQEWLLNERAFLLAYKTLEEDAVRAQFPQLEPWRSEYAPQPDWPHLLFCASVLAPSDLPAAEEAALRIAQSALMDPLCADSERDAALIVLDALSNKRAIELAETRNLVVQNVAGRLGVTHSVDWLRRSFENRIELADGHILQANKFQRRFWAAAGRNSWLSVSAPTSAGKSFILAQWLAEQLVNKRFGRIVYIAPTRALVQQVERDLRTVLNDARVRDVDISSAPFRTENGQASREILVFTQERLHYYLQSFPYETIDALIIDEAHKLSDSYRGILLQDVVEQVVARSPEATVLFTAPLTENPETLLSDAPAGVKRDSLQGNYTTVSQNLLWLEPTDDPRRWEMALRRDGSSTPIGFFNTFGRLITTKAKLATFATLCDSGEGGILVYANGAADAEKYAEAIALKLPALPQSIPVRALDELCDETIHKEYKLRAVLKHGVAFHYGNMPLLLRTAIEDLFRDGHIRYLVCTSTLVEGVNLPCRTIVIRAPKKGRAAMAPADFWNLAGRAGRWGKEFQGNVVCVDTQDKEDWGISFPDARGHYRVERAADRLLNDEGRLLEYLGQGAPAYNAEKNQDLESALSYLTGIRTRYGSLNDAPWRARINTEKLARVDAALAEVLSGVDVPLDWVRRHAGISPLAMQRISDSLLNLKASIDDFLPIAPEDPDASKQYGRIFELMGHHMTTAFGSGGRCHALGILTTNWMLGHPIKRLINARIAWNKRKGIKQEIGATIRATLEDVEQIARFQAPRYLACYSDIMRRVLNIRGEDAKAQRIPDLTLSLEFGVRGPVQLGLMALGLSRSSTLAIADIVTDLLPADVIGQQHIETPLIENALRLLVIDALDVPTLVGAELRELQASLRLLP